MFRKLRWQLTLVCAVGTTLVCLAMALGSLRISQKQLDLQADASFRSNMNAVFYYLQAQSVIDQTWLSQTEADNDLWVRIEVDGVPLRYVIQNEKRDALTRAALFEAQLSMGFDSGTVHVGADKVNVKTFPISLDGQEYMAAVTAMPYYDAMLTIVLLKDMQSQQILSRNLAVGFGVSSAVAVVLLVLFAWFFTGRAVRPVEENQKKQTEFIAAASHELRSPLAVIHLAIDRIRAHPEEAQIHVQTLSHESERMARLVADLLLLAGSDSGHLAISRKPLSLRTLLLDSFESREALAAQAGILMTISLPESSVPKVMGDAQRLEQILSILIDNAISYTPSGGEIALSLQKMDTGIAVLVADTGPGIPDKEKKQIFDRFYRRDDAHHSKEHFGLGLSIAQAIASEHGAKLRVQDTPGGGATFVLELPKWDE